MKNLFKSFKSTAIAVLVIAAVAAGGIYVWAEFVSDTFDDSTKIAAGWNISTSTPGQVILADKECDPNYWFCAASTTCANDYGDGDYIIVYQTDAPTLKQWKTTNTWCESEHCDAGSYILTADNTADFTDYPARDYCKSLGGRLPSITELQCIYNNRASFGTFELTTYITNKEAGETAITVVNLNNGGLSGTAKSATVHVRCVRGW